MQMRITFDQVRERFEKWDKTKLKAELKELSHFINRQVFNQIPSISAVAGITAGTWVASTFTTSPIKGFLSSWGILNGGTHVVSAGTYSFLSVFLPVIATGSTAYTVQKALKTYRGMQLEMNKVKVAGLDKEVQAELQGKLALLEKATEAGIITSGEYQTKKANLYQSYSRECSSKLEELVITKLSSKIQ